MLEIDGSNGEGGGQIIRTALTLAALTDTAIKISNIRAKRPNPGLANQHVTCARSVRKICRGNLLGDFEGSTDLEFTPGPIVGGKYEFNIGTAGSAVLVAQTIIPILLKADKKSDIRIIGGTHVMKSPSYDYFEKIFVPAINRFGAKVECKMINAGYYPKGGGVIDLTIEPSNLTGVTYWPKEETIEGIISIANLDMSIAIREKKVFINNKIEKVRVREEKSLSEGTSVTCYKGYIGSYVIGEKGKRAELVAKEAIENMNCEKGEVDTHLADQLLLYAALAEGKTTYETSKISMHLETNSEVIQKFYNRKITLGNKILIE